MSSLDPVAPRAGRRKAAVDSPHKNTASSWVEVTTPEEDFVPYPSRAMMRRLSTPELDKVEQGSKVGDDNDDNGKDKVLTTTNNTMSVFDVVIPSSVSQAFLSADEDDDDMDSYGSDSDEVDGLTGPSNRSQEEVPKTTLCCRSSTELDVDRYMARREMTPLQERINAITVMPGAFYCFLVLLSGSWLRQSYVEEAMQDMDSRPPNMDFGQDFCLSTKWLPHLYALPPLPVVAATFGIICHAPFSFIYHWSYAHRLPAGFARTNHWSRRMDQAMIHFCSMCMCYATSNRLDYFLVNALFNADCFYRQFQSRVRPRRNQFRILLSVIGYTLPILRRGELALFLELWAIFAISFSLFAFYPIGGWSHAAFHLVIAFVPPLLMDAAIDLPASQEQLKFAAKCAVLAKQNY